MEVGNKREMRIWKNASAKVTREERRKHREWSPETAPSDHRGGGGQELAPERG